ncbi:MAG: right-handed parallel beta-helix repeat-containing protein [Candidatus Binatia bacterium]
MKAIRVVSLFALVAGLSAAWAPSEVAAATHKLSPGDPMQAIVDAAAAGDTVIFAPGDYTGLAAGTGSAALRITKPLKLIAKSKIKKNVRVRILPGAGNSHGIVVEPANPGDPDVDGVMIKGFTVEGFSNNGIWLKHVKNFKIQGNESIDNLENGIWPTLSANGSVKKNVSYGSLDSALWVEASENVRVLKNDLHHSPTGLEVTISKDVLMMKNDIHDNTVGVGLYHPAAAGLAYASAPQPVGNWKLSKNTIRDNNNPNGAPPGGLVSAIPPGGGVLVLGVDDVTLEKNEITGNDFFGIAMIDFCFAVSGTSFDCMTNPPEIADTDPENNRFVRNTVTGNAGGTPPPAFTGLNKDILAISTATTNCFSDNTYGTSIFFPNPPAACL